MAKTNFKTLRKNMVDGQIHPSGVVDDDILNAYETIPRELFVPEDLKGISYTDEGISISHGRFLMEPITHSRIIQAARPTPHDVVLDVATGSGYTAAILSPMVSTIIALESDEDLLKRAEQFWKKTKSCNIVPACNDIEQGCPEHAPYSLILLNGASANVPAALLDQLAPGGRLIATLQKQGETIGQVTVFNKSEDGHISDYSLFNAGIAYLPEFAPKPEFVFS
jgi:protein-L-isoaspartate(D-aspartate) O-methyltransferase